MLKIITIDSSDYLKIRTDDPLFAYGMALFETIAIERGQLFFWRRHWERLVHSAQFLGFGEILSKEQTAVLSAIKSFYHGASKQTSILKLCLFQSQGELNLIIYPREPFECTSSKHLCLNEAYPINEKSVISGFKTHNYFENIHLLKDAREKGFYDYLRINCRGELAETTISNLFLKINDRYITPTLDSGALPGVIRSVLLESDLFLESVISLEDLKQADAFYIMNSIQGIVAIDRVSNWHNEIVFDIGSYVDDSMPILAGHLRTLEQLEAISL
jgi:branched-subunit amino acid aminotransferase/4-amino-4-deoxychorismate lyase